MINGPAAPLLDDVTLKLMTTDVLTEALGYPVKVITCDRDNNAQSTLYPTEVLHIKTLDNRNISLFLKHLGSDGSEHPDKGNPEREVRIYKELFSNETLPVPKYYGYKWNQATQRHELFLENICSKRLKHHDVSYWYESARLLARFHAHFAAKAAELSKCDFLMTFNNDYYMAWADRAIRTTEIMSDELTHRLVTAIKDFDSVADLLSIQPYTLVHNDLSSRNVIVDTTSFPERIVFVDWEMAGIGFGLIDLVHLKYNRLTPDQDKYFCAEYFDELLHQGHLRVAGEYPPLLIDACELFFTLYRIAHSSLWGESLDQLSRRVNLACNINERLAI